MQLNGKHPSLGRRLSRSCKTHRPSRTAASHAKLYVAIPPKDGWPAWTGNYSDYGVRMGRK